MFSYDSPVSFIFDLIAIITSMVFPEFAHAYVSHKFGDPTPELEGRLTLNPFVHVEPVGLISWMLFGFGWARAVRADTSYYKNPKRDFAIVAFAGPLANFIVAFVCFFLHGLLLKFAFGISGDMYYFFAEFLVNCGIINVMLGLFNLLPIPPLDGYKVLGGLLPNRLYYTLIKYESYGTILLLVLIMTGGSRYIGNFAFAVANAFWQAVMFILQV